MTDEVREKCDAGTKFRPCTGVCADSYNRCIAHLDSDGLNFVLKRLASRNDCYFFRGVTVTPALLLKILQAAGAHGGSPTLRGVDAFGATFTGGTFDFSDAYFQNHTDFGEATFEGRVDFRFCRFTGDDTLFGATKFLGGVDFQRAEFSRAIFKNAQFGNVDGPSSGDAIFEDVSFGATASFLGAHFFVPANFKNAHYQGVAEFGNAVAEHRVVFDRAKFDDQVSLSGAEFRNDLSLRGVKFAEDIQWNLFSVDGNLDLVSASFEKRMQANFLCQSLNLERSTWNEGAHLEFACGDVYLDQVSFVKPTLLSFGKGEWKQGKGIPRASAPRLISIRGTNLEKVTLSNFDLGACRFSGAHNIDKLRIEGKEAFSTTPQGFRWTSRIAIAEEHRWRKVTEHGGRQKGWLGKDQQSYAEQPAIPERSSSQPRELAETYRLLRKAREDAKDEPGAKDFYYGEMEMRRAAAKARRRDTSLARLGEWTSTFMEWLVLLAYWFVSGYGTRAWRALAIFALIILGSSVAFFLWGFKTDNNFQGTWPQGVLMSLESATSLLRAPSRPLNDLGELLVLFLRFTGPLLLALAGLALRSRVKR